ncbi:MAG TPA: hypothetical protein VK978_00540 [Candidatus Saccharimonadales bacterium]|nr:hypothetical protein [Candidatus Saccharimonadales bacterium]
MKKRKLKTAVNQQGFIPMMLCIIGVIGFIIYLVYTRVASMAQ